MKMGTFVLSDAFVYIKIRLRFTNRGRLNRRKKYD